MRRLLVKARPFSAGCSLSRPDHAQCRPFPNTTLTLTTTPTAQHACNPAGRRHLSHASDDHPDDPDHHPGAAAATDCPRTPGVRRFYPPANRCPEKAKKAVREETRVSSYASTIEGLCRSRRVDAAMKVLEETRRVREGPEARVSSTCCNLIVGALSAEGRLEEALGLVERFPLYGVAPDASTYDLLVEGFCKRRDADGANEVLKRMARRGLTPTPTTYNHFLGMFAKSGDVDAGVNLFNKLVRSGFAPDGYAHRIVIEMLHGNREFELAVGVARGMKGNGLDLDPRTGAMLVQMLCDLRRFDEACAEFEAMIGKGDVPPYATCRRLVGDLKRVGMKEMAGRILRIMREAPRYWEREGERPYEMRRAIVEKARAMSEALKVSRQRKRAEEVRARRRFFRRAAMRRLGLGGGDKARR